MQYPFDRLTDRRNTDSLKYDFAEKRGKPRDILPLWVADMDFPAPPAVIEALTEKSRHGIFGYSEGREDYFAALSGWYCKNFDWEIRPEWLVKTPSVVFAICAAIRAFTKDQDAVLIQQPVYYPFTESIVSNNRKLVVNQLIYADGKYTIDLRDFEEKIVQNQVKLFILCSPHNPVGRVWTEEELTAMGDICVKHGVIVVSDEIHADFVYPGHRHLVFAGLNPAFSEITVTCTAPTKTFNLAGLQISNILIANSALRTRFRHEIGRAGYSQPNVMGLVACRAAYTQGQEWLDQLRAYLAGNLDCVRQFLQAQIPQIRLVEPEGTYLVWLDCRGLGLDDQQRERLLVEKAGLWLDTGTMFGAGGEGFERVNIACPRATLKEALGRLQKSVENPSIT
ncbi:MalY/PatB family protein [Marasmitruncus massiliensis]|uniref:MalY/PatB family protein n=1 Tax=Marasmitruncus massiliensis TaxID=1944642 RepID=UPI000C7E41ED|nr:MalY/PatB family protein [Marasmitruncus massiliensis]MBE6906345.1 pyridoxal phosphate-dependent aminotransferase [Oscillospiraceae bacterium]